MSTLQKTAGNRAVARLLLSDRGTRVPAMLQAKLMVGAANDPLEREADRVADLVLRQWCSSPSSTTLDETGEGRVRRLAEPLHDPVSAFEADAFVAQRLSARRGVGHALPDAVRGRMEAGFGADFSAVRIHRDAEAAELSTGLAARAFAHGADIYFGQGAYDPSSRSGQHLLAHELTHVTQQATCPADGIARAAASSALQRKYLDVLEPTQAWDLETASGLAWLSTPFQRQAMTAVRSAIDGYRQARDLRGLRAALDAINAAVALWDQTKAYGGRWTAAVDQLKAEVNVLEGLWRDVQDALDYEEAHPHWRDRPREVGDMRALYGKFAGPLKHSKLNAVSEAKRQEIGLRVGHFNKDFYGANFGSTGDLAEKEWHADYRRIEELMAKPAQVRALLEPLDRELEERKDVTLTKLLESYEARCGFPNVHVIPLGVLPADEFLRLIARGVLVKDYGAGVAHGELTHRLQWHAIMRLVTRDFTVPFDEEAGWKHSPYELYVALGKPPFTEGNLTRSALWGRLVDQSDYGSTYSKPAQMNTELMGKPDLRKPGVENLYPVIKSNDWHQVQMFVAEPASLRQIWKAVLKRAAKQNQDVPASRRGTLDEPTSEMMERYAERKASGEGAAYELLSSGTVHFDGSDKEWKMLIRKGERFAYEQLDAEAEQRVRASRTRAFLGSGRREEGRSDLVEL